MNKQQGKALYTYLILFVMVFVYHAFSFGPLKYLIPAFLLAMPYALQGKVKLRLSLKDTGIGIITSALLLIPFWLIMSQGGKPFSFPPANSMFFQLIGISLPEEVYFRGFLQERIGNNIKGLLMASILFSIAHLPQFIFYNDIYSLLTFFPSLAMGFLYLKTSNILPSTIFHFLSNALFLGFYDII